MNKFYICPYCRKQVADMPDHLEKSKSCSDRHVEKLKAQFKEVVQNAAKGHGEGR